MRQLAHLNIIGTVFVYKNKLLYTPYDIRNVLPSCLKAEIAA